METFLSVPPLHATASHIATIQAKLATLTRAKHDAWEQLLVATARLYAAGDLGARDLLTLLDEMRHGYGPGFTRVWDANMPIQSNRLRWVAEREEFNSPTGPFRTWEGEFPTHSWKFMPALGVPVVYVLYDSAREPIYVGSTEQFRLRMRVHQRTKPEATFWRAQLCDSREHAYEMEDRLLKEHKPRLNKKAAR